ncbi:hypothetical protein [Larkinella punicea]|uniref:Outer membrane protein beta-barrel domain-containing protein n=1 Tax=Larkinella punicea TaxID=2315727 RepID=A0A368JTC6_9BACT|nr:hypothetical protein [Larkinella punicea]RCR70585.1 hypothetical protein DUE52_06460 [Larkinella punicea]
MKTIFSTALLLFGGLVAVAQPFQTVSELQISYVRETFTLRDLQASPMRYVANLNGGRLAYTRQTAKNQWRFGLQVGLADFISPTLGIRGIKFSPEQEQPMYLVPTLYRGTLDLEYRRLIHQTANRTTRLGVGLHDTFGYADGLALNTWVMNTAAISALYQTQLRLGKRNVFDVNVSMPVLAAVSRMPYSNVVSKPNSSDTKTFFSGTQLVAFNRFLNPQVGIGYRFDATPRIALRADYRYSWMRYTEPRVIQTAAHAASVSLVYKFQYQSR